MWLVLKGIALRFVVGRTLGGLLGVLLVLVVPVAGILKIVGLPLLFILGLIGAPLMLLLGAIGLPLLIVVGIGAVLMAVLGALLMLGVLAIRFVLPLVLVAWFVRWVWRALRTPGAPLAGPVSAAVD